MDIRKLSELELRITIIELLARLEKIIRDTRASLSEEIKSKQIEVKNGSSKTHSKLDALTARASEAEKRVSDIEDKLMKSKEAGKKREKQLMEHEAWL